MTRFMYNTSSLHTYNLNQMIAKKRSDCVGYDHLLINESEFKMSCITQLTRDIDPMLAKCRPTVYDAEPTLNEHWVNVSYLLGNR